jgi:signal transduction histidine kinase
VAIAETIQNVVAMIAPQSRTKRLDLEVVACPPGIVASGDRIKIEQILLNLLSNAVKFTPSGGRITLSCGEHGDTVWLRVSDTGVGISPEEHETVFAPFVQVGRSLASPKEGTGLGLSISRDLARAMGGDLRVASQEREGATFTLTLRRTEPLPGDAALP